MADIEKLEKYFRTRCREPLRSGLDNRAAHMILFTRRYEFENWVNAMFALIGDRFKDPDDPGGYSALKAQTLKSGSLYTENFIVILLQENEYDHRSVAAGVGYMYFTQLADPKADCLTCGFADGAESIVAGTPSVTIFSTVYGTGDRNIGGNRDAWLFLVKQRIGARQVTPVADLLKLDTAHMVLANYAEAWSLVVLLAKQPEKFGALILKLREEKSRLRAIEEVYGWDEKRLTDEWHKFVMAQ